MTNSRAHKPKSNVWAGCGMIVCFLTATALLVTGLAHEKTGPNGKQNLVAIP